MDIMVVTMQRKGSGEFDMKNRENQKTIPTYGITFLM